jgi:hypothetical protein
MLAGISGLIGLIIFIVIAIVSSLLKRKEETFELPPELKPRRDKPPQQQPTAARSWEEELRHLLEGRAAPPPIAPRAPPPVAPVARMVPAYAPAPEVEEPHIQVSLRTPHARIEPTFKSFGGLTESGSRYSDASHLQERVTQHLADATRHRVGTTSVLRREPSADARELVGTLRDPRNIRRAMLASIILGPPRAFES